MCFAESAALHLRGCSCSEHAAAVAADAAGRMMGMMGMMGMMRMAGRPGHFSDATLRHAFGWAVWSPRWPLPGYTEGN